MSKNRVSISSLRDEIGRLQREVLQLRDVLLTGDKVIVIPLPGTGLEAEVRLKRVGQQDTWEGDEVRVKAEICLPAKTDGTKDLAPQIKFGDRVIVAGRCMLYRWGDSVAEENFRYVSLYFHAPTWKEAFRMAAEWGRAEVGKLAEALEAREKALMDAEVV